MKTFTPSLAGRLESPPVYTTFKIVDSCGHEYDDVPRTVFYAGALRNLGLAHVLHPGTGAHIERAC